MRGQGCDVIEVHASQGQTQTPANTEPGGAVQSWVVRQSAAGLSQLYRLQPPPPLAVIPSSCV
jgi:hypothetical protein